MDLAERHGLRGYEALHLAAALAAPLTTLLQALEWPTADCYVHSTATP
jgi:hypothetical protein